MKNYLLGIITTVIILGILSFSNRTNETTIPAKEWVIAPRFLTLQKGIKKEEAREWMEQE